MAWSNRMMANLHPSRPQSRVLAHDKKPDRPAHHASDTRQVGAMPFAEHRRRPEMASHAEDIPHAQVASSEPAPIGMRSFPADQVVTADAGVATNDTPVALPVSVTSLASAAPDSGTTVRFQGGIGWRYVISLLLGLCSVLSLMAWAWLRHTAVRINALR
jgi:hypothetical protein